MASGVKGKGKAKTEEGGLQAAFENAWKDAKDKGGEPGHYRATDIQVECDNPIRAYIVTIEETGG